MTGNWKKEHVPFYSIITPAFKNFILDSPDLNPETFLTLAIKLVQNKLIQAQISLSNESLNQNLTDYQDNASESNDHGTDQERITAEENCDPENEPENRSPDKQNLDPTLDKDEIYAERYHKIFLFFGH